MEIKDNTGVCDEKNKSSDKLDKLDNPYEIRNCLKDKSICLFNKSYQLFKKTFKLHMKEIQCDEKKDLYVKWCELLHNYDNSLTNFLLNWEKWHDCKKCKNWQSDYLSLFDFDLNSSLLNDIESLNPEINQADDIIASWELLEVLFSSYLQTMMEDWESAKNNLCIKHNTKNYKSFYNDNLIQKLKTISPLCSNFSIILEHLNTNIIKKFNEKTIKN